MSRKNATNVQPRVVDKSKPTRANVVACFSQSGSGRLAFPKAKLEKAAKQLQVGRANIENIAVTIWHLFHLMRGNFDWEDGIVRPSDFGRCTKATLAVKPAKNAPTALRHPCSGEK